MSRLVLAFCLVPLFLGSVGCRICSTPCDHHISAYINRPDDYRGSHPMYRAGTLFGGGSHQMVRYANYEGGEYTDYYINAGNYGVTTPVTLRHTPSTETGTGTPEPRPGTGPGQSPIGIPNTFPGGNNFTFPPIGEPGGGILRIEDLMDPQRGTLPPPTPLQQPPMMPSPNQIPAAPTGNDIMPFSPSDAVPSGMFPGDELLTPPGRIPTTMETDPPITLEELRRLDPTIQDVQILSIEDAATPGSPIR